ncbi:MAG TPA: hypothetical protein VN408_39605, partial [Actinoplanes sp.]|nr:hypothetical protein [Actinoplanes sp.]
SFSPIMAFLPFAPLTAVDGEKLGRKVCLFQANRVAMRRMREPYEIPLQTASEWERCASESRCSVTGNSISYVP